MNLCILFICIILFISIKFDQEQAFDERVIRREFIKENHANFR